MHSELLRAIISECRHYQQETSDEATKFSKETLIFALADLADRIDFPMSDAICAEIIGRSNVLYCGRPLSCLQHSKKDCLSQAEGAESMTEKRLEKDFAIRFGLNEFSNVYYVSLECPNCNHRASGVVRKGVPTKKVRLRCLNCEAANYGVQL